MKAIFAVIQKIIIISISKDIHTAVTTTSILKMSLQKVTFFGTHNIITGSLGTWSCRRIKFP